MHRVAVLLACTLLAPAALVAQQTWIVDSFGSGDFLTIQDGLAAASDGDVVRVMQGTYHESPTVAKNVVLLADPTAKPFISGTLGVTSPTGATLRGLNPQELHVLGAAEPVLLSDMEIGNILGSPDASCNAARVSGCSDVRFERSLIIGEPDFGGCGEPGLLVQNSTVHLVGCDVLGGPGAAVPGQAFDGQPALALRAHSTVYLSGTNLSGGDGGVLFTPSVVGDGAPALEIEAGSTAIGRGITGPFLDDTRFEGGTGGSNPFSGDMGQSALAVGGEGVLVVSGLEIAPPGFPAGLTVEQPSPSEPFMSLTGNHEPGGQAIVTTRRDPAWGFFLFLSITPDTITLPVKVDGPIGLQFGVPPILLQANAGGTATVSKTFAIPALPELSGLVLVLQGFSPDASPTHPWFALNPMHLALL